MVRVRGVTAWCLVATVDYQRAIVYLVIALALLAAARGAYRLARGKGKGCGCGCDRDCGDKKKSCS
jgi:hypothetical protein